MNERREYFRIKDTIPLLVRKISEEEYVYLKRRIRYVPSLRPEDIQGINVLSEKVERKLQQGDELFLFLSMIDKKLNLIMEHLLTGQKEANSNGLIQEEVEISGSGIKFYPRQRFELNDLLEVEMLLPMFGLPRIHLLCQVVRTGEEETIEGEKRAYVAARFVEINENDRDLLVKYIFRRERERLRQQRGFAD